MAKFRSLRSKQHVISNVSLQSVIQPATTEGYLGTKIVFTVGPESQDVNQLIELLKLGATCARIDLTWGSVDFHLKSLANLAEASKQAGIMCATMVDVLGREVFVKRPFTLGADGWPYHDAPISVEKGDKITLSTDPNAHYSKECFPISYPKFSGMVKEGDQIYIGRYLVSGADTASLFLKVESTTPTTATCVSQNDAVLDGLLTVFHQERATSQADVDNAQNQQPLFASSDIASLKRIVAEGYDVDFLSLSYTRDKNDIMEARTVCSSLNLDNAKVIAKVETRSALGNFKSILQYADGVMMSRGNLGLDMAPEKIALVQKNIILQCNMLGKPCIVTRIVDSMTAAPRPTRAEATDVANLVLDGADGVLLGAETVRGKYARETVGTVSLICRAAERVFDHHQHFQHIMNEAVNLEESRQMMSAYQSWTSLNKVEGVSPESSTQDLTAMARQPEQLPLKHQISAMANFAALPSQLQLRNAETVYTGSPYLSKGESIASSSVRVAMKCGAKMLMVLTDTGRTATLVAKYRPSIPVFSIVIPQLTTDNIQWKLQGRTVARQMQVVRGVTPVLADVGAGSKQVVDGVIQRQLDQGIIAPGDPIVVVERLRTDFAIKVMHAPGGQQEMEGDDEAQEDMANRAQVDGRMAGPPTISAIRTLTDLHHRVPV